MIKKLIFIIVFSLSTLLLFGYVSYACPFLMFNQSVSNAAFGLESGTADIRHLDASSFVNNPAKLGLLRGCTITYSNSDYYFAEYKIMKLALNYKGLGISLPMYNFKDFDFERENFGYKVKHPMQLYCNETAYVYGTFQPVESTLSFSLGIDTAKLFNEDKLYFNSCNFYFGSTLNMIKSEIGPLSMGESTSSGIGRAILFDFGSLITYKPQKMQKVNRNITFAFGTKIVAGNNIHYVDENQEDPLPKYTSIGFSSDYSTLGMHPFFKEIREKYHIYSSIDFRKYSKDRFVIGSGIEIGCLDLLSYRLGYTSYSDKDSSGISHSIGLKIVIKNGTGLYFNYLSMLGKNEFGYKKRLDFSLKYVF